jgi:hypothetical protein
MASLLQDVIEQRVAFTSWYKDRKVIVKVEKM